MELLMIGLFGKIFGSEKALTKTIGAVTSGLDALVYTDEEKAQAGAEERAAARQMVVGWMERTQGQNLARRFIAMVVTTIWAIQYVLAMLLDAISVWMESYTEQLITTADNIRAGGEQVTGAMMLVLGFYFAAPHLDKVVGVAMNKFAGSKKEK
jgi:hypothetical protein